MSKDKKKIITAITGVKTSLRKAYTLLNEEQHLPEVIEDIDLVAMGWKIIRTLEMQLAELQENERFEGKTDDEIHELKADEKRVAIAENVRKAGEEFQKLRNPEPAEVDESDDDQDQDPEGDQDEDHEGGEPDPEGTGDGEPDKN